MVGIWETGRLVWSQEMRNRIEDEPERMGGG